MPTEQPVTPSSVPNSAPHSASGPGEPPPTDSTSAFEEVRRAETIDVAARRKVHEPDRWDRPDDVGQDLVGLALSGGGVRSASFNLGLLQALFRFGLLKHVDYLATVSGGGYIGSFLASLTQKRGVRMSAQDPTLRGSLQADPGQPERVERLVRNGKYLNRPRSFANQYLIGLVLNNLAIFSGLAFLCMALACLWRLLDTNPIAGYLYLYLRPSRFWTELWRPFLPAVLLFSLWLLVWILAFVRSLWKRQRPKTRLTGWLLLFALGFLLVGLAVVLATPVISIPDVGTDPVPGTNNSLNEGVIEVSGQQRVIMTTLIGLIVTGLTPFLRPERLLQSGIHPKSIWERRIFLVATSALLGGVPFILIWWFAHHDFAGLDKETRDRQILMGDINFRKWQSFWERVRREGTAMPGTLISQAFADDPMLDGILDNNKGAMKKLAELPVPIDKNDYDLKQKIIDRINWKVIGATEDAVRRVSLAPNPNSDSMEHSSDFAKEVVNSWLKGSAGESKSAEGRALLEAKVRHHGEAPRLRVLLDRLEFNQLTLEEKKELNRLLLEVCYPEEILPRAEIYRPNVIAMDQKYRLWWLLGLGGVFLVSACVSLNATSLHSFYRDRLADTFIDPIPNNDRTIRLSELDTVTHGAPYFLFCATLNHRPRDRDPSMLTQPPPESGNATPDSAHIPPPDGSLLGREKPGETPTETFLLSRRYCGSASLGYRRTGSYQEGRLELDDAMAISGAAFSPVQTSNPFIGFLMTIFNMRLGQWLPDPAIARKPGLIPWWAPSIHRLLWDWLGDWLCPSRGRPTWNFITDGGHHENLGLWPLLERRCRFIIVSDASQDGESRFADLLRVLRRARFERGIRIVGPCPSESFRMGEDKDDIVSLLSLLCPAEERIRDTAADKDGLARSAPPSPHKSKRHFFFAKIEYPAPESGQEDGIREGYLIYLKPTLTGDESVELQGYAALNPDFPHIPTLEQMYDEDRFESYRQLGEHIGEKLCEELKAGRGVEGEMWNWNNGSEDLLQSFSPDENTPQSDALKRLAKDRRQRRSRGSRPGREGLPRDVSS